MSDETVRIPGGQPAAPPHGRSRIPATGEILGGFTLHESLGHGGFAHVYRASSDEDGEVALKVLTNAEHGTLERFVSEATLLARLGGRGFPQFVRGDLEGETPWFAMELVPGPTLQQLVQQNGPLSRRDVLHVADDVTGALAVLQEEHYLHRDVKPANIIASEGRAVLIDLGIAKGHGTTTSTHAAGTIAYMAPELFSRKPHARSDVYSLGLLLVFLATGTLPDSVNFLGRDLTAEDVGPVDERLLPLVLAMTRHLPEDRPPLHNIARTVLALLGQEEPDPGLLDAAEATRAERSLVTEVLTASAVAAPVATAPIVSAPVQPGEPMTNLVYDQALMRRLHELHGDGFDGAAEQVVADHVAAVGLQRAGGRTPGEIKDFVWSAMRWTAAVPPPGYENSYRGWTAFREAAGRGGAGARGALGAAGAVALGSVGLNAAAHDGAMPTQRFDPRGAQDPASTVRMGATGAAGATTRLPPQPAVSPVQRVASSYAPQQTGYGPQGYPAPGQVDQYGRPLQAGAPGGPTPQPGSQHPGGPGGGAGGQGGRPDDPRRDDPRRDDPRRDSRDERGRGDDPDTGWRLVGVVLGTWIPRLLLTLSLYQVVRLMLPGDVMPDASTFPLFTALGDLAVATFGLGPAWTPYVSNMAIPVVGLLLSILVNAVGSLRGGSRRKIWPYVLILVVWSVLVAIQAAVGFAAQVRQDVEQGFEQGIEDAKSDVQDEIDQGLEDAKKDVADTVQSTVDEALRNMFGGWGE
ncbi:serine/threonine protein kinase [Antribacter gilvus]|uniref:serine/threonine protein kinase n=1 Tax=Antribacter gilvus TaxID=2304675 RepID=UPI000F7A8C06|nr:serine/threonine-protein kinase [Antribacter gilvus]